MENAFGILSARWPTPCFKVQREVVRKIVSVCICMHNLVRMEYPALDRGQLDTKDSNPDLVPGDWGTEPISKRLRERLVEATSKPVQASVSGNTVGNILTVLLDRYHGKTE